MKCGFGPDIAEDLVGQAVDMRYQAGYRNLDRAVPGQRYSCNMLPSSRSQYIDPNTVHVQVSRTIPTTELISSNATT